MGKTGQVFWFATGFFTVIFIGGRVFEGNSPVSSGKSQIGEILDVYGS